MEPGAPTARVHLLGAQHPPESPQQTHLPGTSSEQLQLIAIPRKHLLSVYHIQRASALQLKPVPRKTSFYDTVSPNSLVLLPHTSSFSPCVVGMCPCTCTPVHAAHTCWVEADGFIPRSFFTLLLERGFITGPGAHRLTRLDD